MQLMILGKNSEDKGNQLESLTKRILERRGYIDPKVSKIGSGGLEIDVYAEISIPQVGNRENRHAALCECKAHAAPINSTDWLKFIGKLHVEEIKHGGSIHGCMVALNGVNGNVAGIYDDIKQRKTNLELVTGHELRAILIEEFNILPMEKAVEAAEKSTARKIISISLCYYAEMGYWAIQFESDCFLVFESVSGGFLAPDNEITELIKSASSFGEPFNLLEEQKEIERKNNLVRLLFAAIFFNGGIVSIKECIAQCAIGIISAKNENVSESELIEIGDNLASDGFIEKSGESYLIPTPVAGRVFHRLLESGTHMSALISDFYLNNINKSLLDEICAIQGGLSISDENIDHCLFVLKKSPSALLFSTTPNPMLINTLSSFQDKHRNITCFAEGFFLRSLTSKLASDFKRVELSSYYHEKCKIVEIQTDQIVRVKSQQKIEVEISTRERHGIGIGDETLGGGYLHILMIDDAPEPWDQRAPETSTSEPSSKS